MKKSIFTKEQLLAQLKALDESETKTRIIIDDTLPKARKSLLDCLLLLDACHVSEGDCRPDLMRLLKAHEGQAIPLALLRQVLPDVEKLTEARRVLREAGCIAEAKDKAALSIKFVKDYIEVPASVI